MYLSSGAFLRRWMLRFDYSLPSASSPLLPLSLLDDLFDDIQTHLPGLSFASAACVSKSWNQICSRILASPKLASALSLSTVHPSPKVAVKEVIEKVLAGRIRPHFVVADIGSGFGLYAVVTGSNQGIGFGTVKKLAANGIMVVLTALDEKMGLEAIEILKECGLSDLVVFHQLDVTDPASVASLANFVKTQFGKLDILVNNAGVRGTIVDPEAFRAAVASGVGRDGVGVNWSEIMTQTYELAEVCVRTNYYGSKKMTKALLPLLQLSDSPTVVSLSSGMGSLKHIPNGWAKGMLSDAEKLTEDRIDEVLSEFLKDFKEDMLETRGWPASLSAYILSKAAINAFTRIMAKQYPNICINSVSPGFVKTDLNFNTGILTIDEGAESVVRLAMVTNGSPSGHYFYEQEVSPF